jgi:signal transduction histidine kinase
MPGQLTPRRLQQGRPEDWLVGGGEMGKLLRSMDWSQTPLGPLDAWPQSLRTTVSLGLASNFPISLAWGPHHVQIYNDGYWPICGKKHPFAMGQDFSECWASAWPVIGESFERALGGETSFLEDQRMFLDRNGYLEETFFTFSFSPIRDESGGVGGLFHPVTEVTDKMVGERRTHALRDLAARATKAQASRDVFHLAAQALADCELDLPFTAFYRFEPEHGQAHLVASTGLASGTPANPALVDLTSTTARTWPFRELLRTGQSARVHDLRRHLGVFACGPYPEPPQTALLLPLTPAGETAPIGALVVGLSPRLPANDLYFAFCDLVANSVTAALASARAYEQERKRAEALTEIDRAKTAFFSNVSHEFRTPLTLMLGPLEDELAEREAPLPGPRRRRLETAHRNTLRLLKLVNTLLEFSRSEAGRIQARYEPTALAELTAELASGFRSAVERAGLTLTVDCPPLPEPVYVDRDMWEKIVLNLLSNAFKHTFEGGITVTLRWHHDHAALAVADSGVGIPGDELPRVFERFHRVQGTRSRTHEGTGIGLALVQQLTALHGGMVSVTSAEGVGSTFTVTVQAGRDHLAAERIAPVSTPGARAGASAYLQQAMDWLIDAPAITPVNAAPPVKHTGPRPRILWADDNADMRDYVRRLLADHYEVREAADGAAALQMAREEVPDLVLSDIMMPVLDGVGLLRALREDPRTKMVPVILLSARAGEDAAVQGLESGADDYLVKPFAARELLARVRTHLDLARLRRAWANELEQINHELESFSYSVSHDLRAPLRAIDGFSKLLLEDEGAALGESARHYLDRICAATGRMSELIDDLLRLSRLTRDPLRRQSVDLTAVCHEVVEELRRRDPERQVNVEIEPGLTAFADRRLVSIALENLIGNAWKFSGRREGATITVGCQPSGDATEPAFFVRDNGAGFDMAYADKLFQPFQRLHDRTEFEGTGIGLATVQRVVRRHAGRIWAQGAVEQGATFFFTLEDHA